ncbi:hypothetical protein D3C84_867080 [compost metagenome]
MLQRILRHSFNFRSRQKIILRLFRVVTSTNIRMHARQTQFWPGLPDTVEAEVVPALMHCRDMKNVFGNTRRQLQFNIMVVTVMGVKTI